MLEERGLQVEYLRYLEQTPTRDELKTVLALLGADDPKAIIRVGDELFRELRLDDASPDELLDAMVKHPVLVERPIIIHGGRAVIGRPPERALELFDIPESL